MHTMSTSGMLEAEFKIMLVGIVNGDEDSIVKRNCSPYLINTARSAA